MLKEGASDQAAWEDSTWSSFRRLLRAGESTTTPCVRTVS